MARNVPVAGGILSAIGSVFIILVGAVVALVGTLFSFALGGFTGLFYIGLAVGLVMLGISVLIFVVPQLKIAWGILIILLAFVSIPFTLGGLVIGFLLALVGGLLTIFHRSPRRSVPSPTMAPGTLGCPTCGGVVNAQTRTCLNCGRAL